MKIPNGVNRCAGRVLGLLLSLSLITNPSLAFSSPTPDHASSTAAAELFAAEAIVQPLLRWERHSFSPSSAIKVPKEMVQVVSEFGRSSINWFSRLVLTPSSADRTKILEVPPAQELLAFERLGWKLRSEPSAFDRAVQLLKARAQGSPAERFIGRVGTIHTLEGRLETDALKELGSVCDADEMEGTFVWRDERKNDGSLTIWQHERSLEAVLPLLIGPYATDDTRMLIAYARVFH